MNIWFGTGENAWLSNLAERPFYDKNGLHYISVEHAYQTWKSGTFDKVYYKPWKHGSKFIGKKKVNKLTNYALMCKIIQKSFQNNPTERRRLVNLGEVDFTHHQDRGYWRTMFPLALKHAQKALL